MAKTATDYCYEGQDDYRMNRGMPDGDSWQAKARQQGYREAESFYTAHGYYLVADKPDASADGVKPEPVKVGLPDVTAIHIASLIHRATNAEPRLAQRLMNKANALQAKWRNRAVARTLREARA